MFPWHLVHARVADQTTSKGVRQKERSEHFYFGQYLRGPPSALEIKDYYPAAWPIRHLFAAMWHPTNHPQTGPKFMAPFGVRCRQQLQRTPVRDRVTGLGISEAGPWHSALKEKVIGHCDDITVLSTAQGTAGGCRGLTRMAWRGGLTGL